MCWSDKGGISREEFEAYFADCDEGLAIELTKPRPFKEDVSLRDIGVEHAPQGYRYVDRYVVERVLGMAE